jgi:hypothetical protein
LSWRSDFFRFLSDRFQPPTNGSGMDFLVALHFPNRCHGDSETGSQNVHLADHVATGRYRGGFRRTRNSIKQIKQKPIIQELSQ